MKRHILVLALLLVAPLVAADGAREECKDAADRQACAEQWCQEHPDDCEKARDETRDETRDRANDNATARNDTKGPEPRPTQARPDHDDMAERFDGRWVDFARTATGLANISVDGITVIDHITIDVDEARRDGARIILKGEEARLVISDSRTGHIGTEGDIQLQFPAGTTATPQGQGYRIEGPGFRGFLAGDLDVNGTKVHGDELRFHVVAQPDERPRPAAVDAAIERRAVAGEVRLADEQVLVYDDVNITVQERDGGMEVIFDAELDSGRTFVLDVDSSRLAGPELVLRYWDIQEDGSRTEVVFREADDLDDILDPDDDGGQPEYWIVEDADGVQVMVSVPHWSVHAISLHGVGAFLTQPSVLVGAAAGIIGVAAASMLLLRPRRDD